MTRPAAVCLTLLALVAALVGCGGGGSKSSTAAPAASASGPAAVSAYDSGPRAADTPRDEARAEEGKALFQTKGCSACHAFGKRLSCPDLAGVTKRRTVEWMTQQILHPEVMTKSDPIAHELYAQYALQMPNQGLTPEQAAAVIEYFKHMDHEASETESK